MSGLRLAVEDRKADAVAHLAVARSQNTGPAFWVTTKDKGGRLARPLFFSDHYSIGDIDRGISGAGVLKWKKGIK